MAYLTLNTLIREDEMHLALQMATQAVKDHVDGILVQDIGLASEIRKNISYAGLHASTQMSVSNHYGVKVLHDMGFQRVVLARELNYQEANAIKQICLESNDMSQMEIEVFIHGGLCIAYSGQCFSSSYCFGSSANRGRCLMTCWKGYELKAGKKVLERGSLLRPRDLEGLYGLKHLMETVYDKVDAIVKNYAIKGIVLSNVSDLMLIGRYVGKCLEYISGNDLHIYNHFTADSLMKMGVRMGTYSLELPFDGCAELKEHTSLPMQQIVFGHSELMHMKYCLLSHSNECDNCGRCKDEKYGNLELNGEAEFYVKINKFQTETVLYSKKTFSADTTRVVGDSLRFDFMNESVLQMNSIIEDIKSGWFYTGREYVNEILKGE